jgi:hypothetical protein
MLAAWDMRGMTRVRTLGETASPQVTISGAVEKAVACKTADARVPGLFLTGGGRRVAHSRVLRVAGEGAVRSSGGLRYA